MDSPQRRSFSLSLQKYSSHYRAYPIPPPEVTEQVLGCASFGHPMIETTPRSHTIENSDEDLKIFIRDHS